MGEAQEQARAEWEKMAVHYPFPLVHGKATLILPKEITRRDAERLATFVKTLVTDG